MNSASIRSLSLVTLTAALVILITGCTNQLALNVDRSITESELPALLSFSQPFAGLLYTEVDDIDPILDGIQLKTRIIVNDIENNIWLEDIILSTDFSRRTVSVKENDRGERVAETVLTFAANNTPTPVSIRVEGPGEDAIAILSFSVADHD